VSAAIGLERTGERLEFLGISHREILMGNSQELAVRNATPAEPDPTVGTVPFVGALPNIRY
jgi:hypothetical protein